MNNWLHALFSQVEVYLNDTLVTPSTNTYPFHAYIETLLSYGTKAKETQLMSKMKYKDTAGNVGVINVDNTNAINEGFVAWLSYITVSRVVEIMGRLHVDLFLKDRFLINRASLKTSKDTFPLLAGGADPDYKEHIVDATVFAGKATQIGKSPSAPRTAYCAYYIIKDVYNRWYLFFSITHSILSDMTHPVSSVLSHKALVSR